MKYKLNDKIYHDKLRSIKTKDKLKFHNYLTELLDIKPNYKVLDLGCGHGNTLMYIATKLGVEGKAIGVDIDEDLLAVAETILKDQIKNKKLELIKADLTKPLNLQAESFDRIVCHNVIECIPDKVEFLNKCFKLLKDGGVLVLSHSDFDTQIYNSSNIELTRKLIHNYSDFKQDWMETSDGMIGRKLSGIFAKSKFKNIKSEIYIMQNNKYSPREYGYRIAQDIIRMAKKSKKFTNDELRSWVKDLKEKSKNSEYFYSSNVNIIVAKK